MKKKLLHLLSNIIYLLNDWHKKLIDDCINNDEYQSLTPIDNADEDKTYSNAILWALENRKTKNIKNIALTGSYGSGKSSILKTFQKNHQHIGFNFLNISLATFKDSIDKDADSIPKNDDELLRLIELSILQQIFYHVENNKIPDSRFKKINSIGKRKLVKYTIGIIIWLIAICNLFFPSFIYKLLLIKSFSNDSSSDKIIHYFSIAFAVIGAYILISKAIRIFKSSKINKLNIQSGEIEINKEIDKSILNNHLDEILYFFEVTSYNVVIIEDLDRFGQTEIFTKFRELNSLINNSLQVNKDIVFIYAVKDDMFKDKDRTKFFDFIIPIIPVINSSNSNEILSKKLLAISDKISTELIDDISLFIDDMRLLNNILNEYKIYQKKLSNKLSQDKLLAMIVYKNIHPEDFVNLHNSDGTIYEIINKKQEFIKTEILKIDTKIIEINNEIKIINAFTIKNIKELRALYIETLIEKIPKSVSIKINNEEFLFSKLKNDVAFKSLMLQNSISYYYYHPSYGSNKEDTSNIKFSEIENLVDPEYTYTEREQLIEDRDNQKTEILKKRIEGLNKEKLEIKSSLLKEVLERNDSAHLLDNGKQDRLINILLRNGYIDEDYHDYISHFYEGSLTREDKDFLINVKSQTISNFNYKLNKVENLVKKIKDGYFEKEYILNYNLVDFLLKSSKYKTKLKSIFSIISNQSDNSIAFIDGYIAEGKNTSAFMKKLCEEWKEIWFYIESQSNFSTEKKNEYLKLIFEFANVSSIKLISNNSKLINYISNKKDFLTIITNENRIKEVIKELNPKFKLIEKPEQTLDLFNFIYEGDFYEINFQMIQLILELMSKSNDINQNEANYTAILNSDCNFLINYIDKNIEKYILDVFIKLENNTKETEEAVIALINHEKITIENRKKIIEKEDAIISNLETINEISLCSKLLILSKVKANWNNIVNYYEHNENSVDEAIITFFNNLENAAELSQNNIPFDEENEELIQKLSKEIILEEDITDDNYTNITKSIPFEYDNDLEFDTLSDEKVSTLIYNGILTLSLENYELLKNNFDVLHIRLLEYYANAFIANIEIYELNAADSLKLLNSESFSPEQKIEIIINTVESSITSNKTLTDKTCEIVVNSDVFAISPTLLNYLAINTTNVKDKISLFNKYSNKFKFNEISVFIQSLHYPYSDIAIKRKRPLIENNQVNTIFVTKLKAHNYISKFDFEEKGIRVSTFVKN